MKTLILILVMMTFEIMVSYSQLKIDDPHGYLNHAGAGLFVGASSNVISYQFLTKHTSIKTKHCKIISLLIGVGSGFLAGHVFESWQMGNGGFYSKNDMLFAGGGSIVSSVGVSWIFNFKGSVPLSRVHDVEFIADNDRIKLD